MPPLLGGKGTAHAGSTWVTCQIREKNYGYRTPSESPCVCVGSVQVAAPREEEEEEGLFKADAVNEEDPERDRATQV